MRKSSPPVVGERGPHHPCAGRMHHPCGGGCDHGGRLEPQVRGVEEKNLGLGCWSARKWERSSIEMAIEVGGSEQGKVPSLKLSEAGSFAEAPKTRCLGCQYDVSADANQD
jgi:hypothetical protein